MSSPRPRPRKISAVVSDVDGTLVRDDKSLSEVNRSVVAKLRQRGVAFALVSSRPPRGLAAVIAALDISTVVAGFNGGVIADPRLEVLEQHLLAPVVALRTVEALAARGVDAWVFSGREWFLQNPNASNVTREIRTVNFQPTVVPDFGAALETAGKIVGVSQDAGLLERCEAELSAELSGRASVARSQPYYLDITHPLANKGAALRAIARLLAVPLEEIAVIGDGPNDVAMFAPAGFSIAMGNAEAAVQRAADVVTDTNNADGFAAAMDRFILSD
ncbi:MAG: HAD family hydrolase [Caulobacteraceae bacterium]